LGLLYLNGPLRLEENDTKVTPAEITWNKEFGMIFIDNPVGTGFSYVDGSPFNDPNGFVTNQEEVGRDIYEMLIQFYDKYPDLADNALYITGWSFFSLDYFSFFSILIACSIFFFFFFFPTGESYAGKYCPGVADYIRRKNLGSLLLPFLSSFKNAMPYLSFFRGAIQNQSQGGCDRLPPFPFFFTLFPTHFLPLKPCSIGNGLTDPGPQVDSLAEHVYNLGLIDSNQAEILEGYQEQVRKAIEKEDWLEALDARNVIYNFISQWTGGINFYDVRRYDSDDFSGMDRFLNMENVRKSLNVGEKTFTTDPRVYNSLRVLFSFPLFLLLLLFLCHQKNSGIILNGK